MTTVPGGHRPAVSIGMPLFNAEPWLRGALDALLRQTFTDFELIISDNASTDATAAICDDYVRRDSRIRYQRQPENLGYVRNFRVVLEQARAERFMWAACDDLWEPEFLERLVAALDGAPKASLAFCQLAVLAEADRPGWTLRSVTSLTPVSWLARVSRYLLQSGTAGKPNLIYGLMRRRFALACDALGRYPPFGHDMLFVFQMLLQGHFTIVPAVMFYKRQPTRRYWQLGEGFLWMLSQRLQCSWRYADVARRFGCSIPAQLLVLVLALTRTALDTLHEIALGAGGALRRAFGRSAPHSPTSAGIR
jgi:glycosyltransferase involved in cell wall biosynthesis